MAVVLLLLQGPTSSDEELVQDDSLERLEAEQPQAELETWQVVVVQELPAEEAENQVLRAVQTTREDEMC